MTEQKKLLALDGGGLLGLISLGVLKAMEGQLRDKLGADSTFRLRDYFDFIGGTSTGAIIAAGLMTGRTAKDIEDIYLNHGKQMFTKDWFHRRATAGFSYKYQSEPLIERLKTEFGTETVLEMQTAGTLPTDKHLLLVLRNAQTASCWPFSTNPDAEYNRVLKEDGTENTENNRKIPLWQLIRASTAAPSFFKPEFIRLPDGKRFPFEDGGLTAHNNSALKMFQMATQPEYAVNWKSGAKTMLIVSVGTGDDDSGVRNLSASGSPLLSLAKRTPSNLMLGINVENDLTCRMIGQCVYGPKIDEEVGDVTAPRPFDPAFSYVRYSIDTKPKALKELKVSFPGDKLEMDRVDQMPAFVEIGTHAGATVEVAKHFKGFLQRGSVRDGAEATA